MKPTRINQADANFLELPYTKLELKPGMVVREGGLGVDVRSFIDWGLVLHVDTAPYSTGFIVVYGETRMGAVRGITLEDSLWAEIRVVTLIHEVPTIVFEGGVGHTLITTDTGSGGPLKTPGPVVLPFLLGEVPDTIDVYARMRRGGATPYTYDADEILNVIPSSRFRL